MSEDVLLNGSDVCELLGGIHRGTLWRFCKSGQLPMPLKVGGQNRWKASDIHTYIQERQAAAPERRPRKLSKGEIGERAREAKKRRVRPEPSTADNVETTEDLRLAGAPKRHGRVDTPTITSDYFANPLSELDRERLTERGGTTLRWRL